MPTVRPRPLWLLAVMALALLALVVTILADLVAHPRDLWTVAEFGAGTLLGIAWERSRARP